MPRSRSTETPARPRTFGRPAVALGLISILALGAACGDGGGGSEAKIAQVSDDVLPPTVMGMAVARENIEPLIEDIDRPFLSEVGLFAFRREELLQATVQVSRFSDDADWRDAEFRRTVAGQIIGTTGELPEYRMGDHTVFLGGNARQLLAVWYEGPFMMTMAVRNEFDEPRGLLRRLIELKIGSGAAS